MIARLEWVLNFGDDGSFPSQIVRDLENEYNFNHDMKNFVRDDVIKWMVGRVAQETKVRFGSAARPGI